MGMFAPENGETMCKGVSKGEGLRFAAATMGVPLASTASATQSAASLAHCSPLPIAMPMRWTRAASRTPSSGWAWCSSPSPRTARLSGKERNPSDCITMEHDSYTDVGGIAVMTSKQNNYLREREKANARSPFSKRTPERVIMCAGAVYSVGMAIFFALSYFGVISSTSEAARTSAQAVTALSRNSSNTALIILYAIVTAGVAAVTIYMAVKHMQPGPRFKWTVGWMIFVMVFSLFTADMVGLIAFGVAFGMYMTRDWQLLRAVNAANAGKRSSKR